MRLRPNYFLIPLSAAWLLLQPASEVSYTAAGEPYTMEQVGPNHYEIRLEEAER